MKIPHNQRTLNNKLYQKIRNIHKAMMRRCYVKTSQSYKNYGAKGVYVAKEWHTLDGFLQDFDKITGYNETKFMAGQLQLDKDKRQLNVERKVYSLETTEFITPSENSGFRETNRKMILISPQGDKFIEHNREKFCREHGLSSRHLFSVLNGRSRHYKGWQAFYLEEFSENKLIKFQKIVGKSPEGEIFEFNNIQKFAREHGLSAPNINMTMSGKQSNHKGWTFEKIQSGGIIQ